MTYNEDRWTLLLSSRAARQYKELPAKVTNALDLLAMEIKALGPVRGNWKNYGKLSSDNHHCHVRRGRPTYVACWQAIDSKLKIVEIYYVGTHENAPY